MSIRVLGITIHRTRSPAAPPKPLGLIFRLKRAVFFAAALLVAAIVATLAFLAGSGGSVGSTAPSYVASEAVPTGNNDGPVHVRTYTRSDGTVVHQQYRTRGNGTKADNWSTEGNVNPETGEAGKKNRHKPHHFWNR